MKASKAKPRLQTLRSLFAVAERLGVEILPTDEGSCWSHADSKVYLDADLSGAGLAYTLAHELGHAEQTADGFRGEAIHRACQDSDPFCPEYSDRVRARREAALEPDAWIRGEKWIAPELQPAYRRWAAQCLSTYSLPSPFDG